MKPVFFHPEAKREFDDAVAYYEAQREGLGDALIATVMQAVRRIAQMPQAFPVQCASVARKCVLRKFPYNIFFQEMDDAIWIAAIAHQRRRPGYWRGRQRG